MFRDPVEDEIVAWDIINSYSSDFSESNFNSFPAFFFSFTESTFSLFIFYYDSTLYSTIVI